MSDACISANSTFATLLSSAAVRKPDDDIFLPGYDAALADVAQASESVFCGLALKAAPMVYSPGPNSSTEFIVRNWWAAHLENGHGRTLLELGCGTGALTLHAAKHGWLSAGGDVNPVAIECAIHNASTNGLTSQFAISDLFEKFAGQRFDVVLFNLPYMHKPDVQSHEIAVADAEGALARRFLDEAREYLTKDGRIVFTYSNCSDAQLLDRPDWTFSLVACDYESRGRYWRMLVSGAPN